MIRVRCSCGAEYKVPDSAAGKRANCKKCSAMIAIPTTADLGPLPLAPDPPRRRGGGDIRDDPFSGPMPTVGPVPTVAAAEPFRNSATAARTPIETGTARTYTSDLLASFTLVGSLGGIMTFALFLFLLVLARFVLPYAGCLGLIGTIMISGLYYAYLFEVVVSTAAGEDELPLLTMTEGFFGSFVVPFFKWIGSWLLVLLPGILFAASLLGMSATALAPLLVIGPRAVFEYGSPETGILVVLLTAGMFLWPMVILCISLGGFSAATRVDLFFITIARTLPVYFLTTAMLYGSYVGEDLLSNLLLPTDGSGPTDFLALVARGVVVVAFAVYTNLVAMRAIGLYYHHFKHRFAWDWG